MYRLLLVGVLLIAAPLAASAQTHPCDQATATTVKLPSNSPHKIQFCAKPSEAPEAMTIYINGTASDLRSFTMVAAANTTGYAFYEGLKDLQFAKGSYDLRISLWNREYPGGPVREGEKSLPLSLIVDDVPPPPSAPRIIGIVK